MVIPTKFSQFKNIRVVFSDKNDAIKYSLNYFGKSQIASCQQIHSDRIAFVANPIEDLYQGCDGLITAANVFLRIKTADCLPIFFYDPKKQIIAAIHVGWKGLLVKVVENTINSLYSLGSQPKNIMVCVGPHIKKCCFRVSDETYNRFISKFDKKNNFFIYRNNKWLLNLEKIVAQILLNHGLQEKNIEIMPWCTFCSSRFFSYRRDGINTGRMYNLIGFRRNI